MQPERWRRAKSLFQSALAVTAEERASFLRARALGDAELLAEALSLLRNHRTDTSFIEPIGLDLGEGDLPPGRVIGAYRVVRPLGRGGLSIVYLAERDDASGRQVAVKLARRGAGVERVLRHFRNERRILARLDHPGVAKLLDARTTAARRPFLIMELVVGGEPITCHCERRGLALAERLELFRGVCAVVQYVHQKRILHRDLKPANILVDVEGRPRLLDFGIARPLNPAGAGEAASAADVRAFTPAYASPEQVRGAVLSVATDVYSLGVLLYELLTGRSPYRLATNAVDEIARAVCEQEVEPPSRAAGDERLAGDLDVIVLQALRKEPEQRYGSVEQLSAALRRHQERLPTPTRTHTICHREQTLDDGRRAAVRACAGAATARSGAYASAGRHAPQCAGQPVRPDMRRHAGARRKTRVRLAPRGPGRPR